uniref:Uncharacterized protein n=1 Tax=Nymphaea colorata TaxID=210225 RepID=A0A5K0YXD4_9MAGN|nr:unnamed protein product [Nymphaea colorata]
MEVEELAGKPDEKMVFFRSAALLLVSPSPITFSNPSTTCFLFTAPFPRTANTAPTLRCSATKMAFCHWSPRIGHARIGTPHASDSKLEFHPQWDTNPPVDGWLRISSCGAQPRTTNPLSFTFSSNPCGSIPNHGSFADSAPTPAVNIFTSAWMTQMNGRPDSSRAAASSASSAELGLSSLPKDTKTTDPTGLESSHASTSSSLMLQSRFDLTAPSRSGAPAESQS